MRMVIGLEEAREVLCADRGLHLDRVPPHVLERSTEAFGEVLTPAQVVERILKQVRESGDAAPLTSSHRCRFNLFRDCREAGVWMSSFKNRRNSAFTA